MGKKAEVLKETLVDLKDETVQDLKDEYSLKRLKKRLDEMITLISRYPVKIVDQKYTVDDTHEFYDAVGTMRWLIKNARLSRAARREFWRWERGEV